MGLSAGTKQVGPLVQLSQCRSSPSVDVSLFQMGLKERDAAVVLEPGLALGWEKRFTGCVVWGKGVTVRLVGGAGVGGVPWVECWARKDQGCLGTC